MLVPLLQRRLQRWLEVIKHEHIFFVGSERQKKKNRAEDWELLVLPQLYPPNAR